MSSGVNDKMLGYGLLQAQCILFRRYPDVLEPFKYGGYPMLLGAVTLPDDDTEDTGPKHFLAPEKAPLLQASSSSPLPFLPAPAKHIL